MNPFTHSRVKLQLKSSFWQILLTTTEALILASIFTTMGSIQQSRKQRVVAIWLLIGVVMLFIQIALGGLTRLTGSGLSMTEWEPIMGFIPPLHESEWQQAFEQYQQIAQFKYLNHHYTLSDFKFIFFWEWLHRNWARFIALVFLIPFFFFMYKKYFSRDMIPSLILLFVFGILQGFIGWYMVKSGLDNSSLFYVSHVRLSVHLVSALGLLAYTLWFALQLMIPKKAIVYQPALRNSLFLVVFLLIAQLFYGAFMAGLHAAAYAPSWPTMNGYWIPPKLSENSWINHPANVQFIHRAIAYLLLLAGVWVYYRLRKYAQQIHGRLLLISAHIMMIILSMQVLLGIITVLCARTIEKDKFGIFETFAQLHQLVAMLLVASIVLLLYQVRGRNSS